MIYIYIYTLCLFCLDVCASEHGSEHPGPAHPRQTWRSQPNKSHTGPDQEQASRSWYRRFMRESSSDPPLKRSEAWMALTSHITDLILTDRELPDLLTKCVPEIIYTHPIYSHIHFLYFLSLSLSIYIYVTASLMLS